MRRFRRSERGLSEIVGTLLLILIVVSAATLLAAFVASYQKQLQTEETQSHDQSLESIEILGLITSVSGDAFTSFSFTLASEYVNPSGILDVYINGNPLLDFAWDNLSTGTSGVYNAVTDPNPMTILPFDQVQVGACLTSTCTIFGQSLTESFLPGEAPVPNQYIKFDIFTHLHNDFTRVYLPPTPIPVVSETNPSGNNPLTLLDGSMSLQAGGNATIVEWLWTASGGGLPASITDSVVSVAPGLQGAEGSGSYTGTASSTFPDPSDSLYGSGYAVALEGVPTSDLSDNGAGCVTTAATVGPFAASDQSVDTTTNTITITYPFAVTIGSCTGTGTIGFPTAGGNVAIGVNASGEEFELSPALPPLSGSETPYLVTLVAANSDGLDGTVTVTYAPPE